MRTIRIAVVLGVLAFVAVVGLILWRRLSHDSHQSPQAESASSATGPRSQAELLDEIVQKGVTPERAKLLFSMQIGKLPGVAIPSNIPRDPSQFDGTPAATYLMAVWETLTQEQRQVAAKLLGLPAPSSARRIDGTSAVVTNASFRTEDKPAYDYGKYLKDADGALSALLDVVPGMKFNFDVDYDNYPPNGSTKAETLSWSGFQLLTQQWGKNQAGGCHVQIYNKIFVEDVPTAEDARGIMTHEMMHCYQEWAVDKLTDWNAVPQWIKEGEAMWAQATVVPGGGAVIAKDWNDYVSSINESYSVRKQDAIGVFGHLSDTLGDLAVWQRLLPVIRKAAPQNANDTLKPFDLLIQGIEDEYLSSWGSSYFLTSGKVPWTMTGPGYPPTSGAAPGDVTLNNDTTTIVSVSAPYTARIVKLSGDADVALIGLMTGYGRLRDQSFQVDTRLDTSGSLGLCLKPGGCTCKGTDPGASLNIKNATKPLSIGLEAAETGADVLVIGHKLDLYCKEPDPRPKQPNAGGGGGGGGGGDDEQKPMPRGDGSSQGDTHLTTFDGLRYDFQVVGEYTLVRSTKDDFAVQVRQVPVLKSRTVTVNQAMATKVGDNRVTVAIENNALVLRIDGRPVTDSIPKLAGGSIATSTTVYGTTYLISYADGTTVRVEQLGPRVINVRVKPAESRRGALAGLLGDADGSRDNDLVGTGGARLGVDPSPDALTHSLADAWRISQSQSLFDYLPGQSTATFADRTFPDAHVDPGHVGNRAEAEKNCREAGITDQRLLSNCILDFAVTSDFLFTSSYSHEQQVLAARAHKSAPTASGVLNTVTMAGSVTDPASKPSFEFKAQAGDIIWIGVPDCTDNYMGMSLVDPSGKTLPSEAWPCAMGRVVLPSSGTYALRAYKTQSPLGAYSVPIRFVRADQRRDIKYGDIVSGQIETRGAHDVYTFSGRAGDVIRISGEGCELSTLVVGIILPNDRDVLGPSCRAGSDTILMETGTHQLVINAANGGEGAYHFVLQGASGK